VNQQKETKKTNNSTHEEGGEEISAQKPQTSQIVTPLAPRLGVLTPGTMQFFGSTEKTAIILEIGASYTKCGFAGESKPRFIFPSELKLYTGEPLEFIPSVGSKATSQKEWEEAMELLLNSIYFKYLQTNPKERRALICETTTLSQICKNAIKTVLLNKLKVPSVIFVPIEQLYLIPLSAPTGLVIDCGYLETRVFPIYEGIVLKECSEVGAFGSKLFQTQLSKLLYDYAILRNPIDNSKSTLMKPLDQSILESIAVSVCFVEPDSNYVPPPPPSSSLSGITSYVISSNQLLDINEKIRGKTANILFEMDGEGVSLITLILDSLLKCPIDSRRHLAARLLLAGGCSMLPGFKQRVFTTIKKLISINDKYKELVGLQFGFLTNSYPANYLGWVGGSVIGCLESAQFLSISEIVQKTLETNK